MMLKYNLLSIAIRNILLQKMYTDPTWQTKK